MSVNASQSGESDLPSDHSSGRASNTGSPVATRALVREHAFRGSIDDLSRDGSIRRSASVERGQGIGNLHVCDHTCNCDDE